MGHNLAALTSLYGTIEQMALLLPAVSPSVPALSGHPKKCRQEKWPISAALDAYTTLGSVHQRTDLALSAIVNASSAPYCNSIY